MNENRTCCTNCSCGPKKAACKNKAEEGQEIRDLSAFACHRRNVEESEVQIKGTLYLLGFLCNLCKHKGSIFLGPSTHYFQVRLVEP